jgi:hypothetical protein
MGAEPFFLQIKLFVEASKLRFNLSHEGLKRAAAKVVAGTRAGVRQLLGSPHIARSEAGRKIAKPLRSLLDKKLARNLGYHCLASH